MRNKNRHQKVGKQSAPDWEEEELLPSVNKDPLHGNVPSHQHLGSGNCPETL